MIDKLPTKLGKEPLVEAVFEVRFALGESIAEILPGFLMAELGPDTKISKLSTAAVPFPVRQQDPVARYQPTIKLASDHFDTFIGDYSVLVSCRIPYPGWDTFECRIHEIMGIVSKVNQAPNIDRYSLKYANIIEATSHSDQLAKLTTKVIIGDDQILNDQISLRVQKAEDELTHIIEIVTGVGVTQNGGPSRDGVLVSIDSVCSCRSITFSDWIQKLPENLRETRLANKHHFFNCLTTDTVKEMDPTYG